MATLRSEVRLLEVDVRRPLSVRSLRKVLANGSDGEKLEAIVGAEWSLDESVEPLLASTLVQSSDGALQRATARRLGDGASEESRVALLEAFRQGAAVASWDVAAECAAALWRRGYGEVMRGLAKSVETIDPEGAGMVAAVAVARGLPMSLFTEAGAAKMALEVANEPYAARVRLSCRLVSAARAQIQGLRATERESVAALNALGQTRATDLIAVIDDAFENLPTEYSRLVALQYLTPRVSPERRRAVVERASRSAEIHLRLLAAAELGQLPVELRRDIARQWLGSENDESVRRRVLATMSR